MMYRIKYSIICMSLLMMPSLYAMNGHTNSHTKNIYQLKKAQYPYAPEGSRTSKKRELAQHMRYEKKRLREEQQQQRQQENVPVTTLLALQSVVLRNNNNINIRINTSIQYLHRLLIV